MHLARCGLVVSEVSANLGDQDPIVEMMHKIVRASPLPKKKEETFK